MQQGKPRIDLKIGGDNLFIAPVALGDRVNAGPDHALRGLIIRAAVTGIDAIAADLKAKGSSSPGPTTHRPGVRVCVDPRNRGSIDRAARPQCQLAATRLGDSAHHVSADDELMGARPMARVIKEHIKKPLADEVLFGRLKSGGHVRVVVITDESGNSKLNFEYPDGPVTPRAERLPEPRRAKAKRRSSPRRNRRRAYAATTHRRAGSVPKVPLFKV